MESLTWTDLQSSTSPSNPHSRSMGTASIHDFMHHRHWERSRADDRSCQPRRRNSVVISSSNSIANTDNYSSNLSSTLTPIGTRISTLSTSPPQLPSRKSEMLTPHLFETSDPWQTISDAMGSATMSLDSEVRLRGLQCRDHERRM